MDVVIFLFTVLCLSFLLVFIRFMYILWLRPIRIDKMIKQQGIKGFSYRFPHGNTKEVIKMNKEAMSKPMDLSHHIFPRVQPHLHSWLQIYGKNFVTWDGPRAEFIVSDIDLVKEILNKDQVYPKNHSSIFVRKLLGDGLVMSVGQKWVKQRKLANHAFHGENLKSMTSEMIASVKVLLERWKEYEGKEMESFKEFRLLTSDIISRIIFGSSHVKGKEIFENLTKYGEILSRNRLAHKIPGLSLFYRTKDEVEADKLEQGMHDSIVKIMEKREKANERFGSDLLGLLMKAMNDVDGSNRITLQDVVDECKTFYIAGQETTSSLLGWITLLLAIHTDWQEKARQEVFNMFGNIGMPNSDDLPKLKTMHMIINETLRLYPPGHVFLRKVEEETRLRQYILPAKTHIIVPVLALHTDPEIWGEDAHLFKPERFSQGIANATNYSQVFLPFGTGPRNCVGNYFAIQEAKIALSMILQRYRFTLSPAYSHAPAEILSVSAQHGAQLKLHRL